MRAAFFLLMLAMALPAESAQERSWNFRVFLDGREVGHHDFTLSTTGAETLLRSEAHFQVRFLFIDAYRYTHRAEERWRDGCLVSLASSTDTNGTREGVSARARGSRLAVERAAGREEHEGCVMSFAYWNPKILSAPRLLNAQTGELTAVQAATLGPETLIVRGRPTAVLRHRLTAPGLAIDLWYDGGEWVALESNVAGGRRLRYELI